MAITFYQTKNSIIEFYYNSYNTDILEILSINAKIQNINYKIIRQEIHLVIEQIYKIEFINKSYTQGVILTNQTASLILNKPKYLNNNIFEMKCIIQKTYSKYIKKDFIYIATLINIEYKP
ncbi:MAG: hypothetical protein ACRC41_03565 [Sarcina sp.]